MLNRLRYTALAGLSFLALVGCGDSGRPAVPAAPGDAPVAPAIPVYGKARTRYQFHNQCFALRAEGNGLLVRRDGARYLADAADTAAAEPFYFKPAALGDYLLYGQDRQLLAADGAGAAVAPQALDAASPAAEWTLRGQGDTTVYAIAPAVDTDPDAGVVQAYRAFVDPHSVHETFGWQARDGSGRLAIDSSGALVTTAVESAASVFRMEPLPAARCARFPEAQDNVVGETFRGTASDGTLIGYADTHLHATSTTFLGGAKPGWPFHKYGVTHALASCAAEHGPTGQRDAVGSLFTADVDGHSTNGWPQFTDWPSRTATTHEATYWKWIERAWKSGLRLIVNFAVDNATLCEIQRNVSGEPLRNCNEMVSAGRQLATAYAMQDYIDAQYGGRGAGWWRIVTTPAEARAVIADGKAAVLLGVEVSNLLDCSVAYNPASTQEAFEETGDPASGGQRYGCAMTQTGAPNEIVTQLERLKALGVTNLFTIHEFDNAFGGSDIFDGLVLNLGTKENSGGLADNDIRAAQAALPAQAASLGALQPNGLASGEYWSTYDCPTAEAPETGGFIFPAVGAVMTNLGPPPPLCPYTGQGGRAGGATACYPAAPQCNARLLTPLGLYAYEQIMRRGFLFEIDHLGYELKNQLLDLSEAQSPAYPTVSAHGFSGLTVQQARRIYAGGGLVYPTFNDVRDFIALWGRLKPLWQAVGAPAPFGFGFGTDTNGLSPQSAPRATIEPGKEVRYPFTLFRGGGFEALPELAALPALRFEQPSARDPDGNGRDWHVDTDGNAHHGMAADSIEELRLEGQPEQLRDVYRSAEAYVRFWERTRAAQAAIVRKGLVVPPGLLREAPDTP